MRRLLVPALLLFSASSIASADPPRTEPVTFDLAGWTMAVSDDGAHRHVDYRRPGTTCVVMLDRWWGLPPNPGPPLTQQSQRPVTVDGQSLSLLTATAGSRQGEVLFVHHGQDYARVWFTACTAAEEADVLAHTRLAR
ncbi:MAG: hypothetical protein WCJ30_19005 [Deltaproteobacteria bacterium]